MERKPGCSPCIDVTCWEARDALQASEATFARMRSLKPLVDQAIAAHSRNQLSEGRLKRILVSFADAQTDYTNAFRSVIDLMEDDDSEDLQPPVLALPLPDYSNYGPPPPYQRVPPNMGINVRCGNGLRRRARETNTANNSWRVNSHAGGNAGGGGGGGGGGPGDDSSGDPPPPYDDDDHVNQGGCCCGCLRNLLNYLGDGFSAFVDLVKTCLQALWDFICFIGGKILELAQMIRQMVTVESQRIDQLLHGAPVQHML